MSIRASATKAVVATALAALLLAPVSLQAIVPPAVLNEKAEKSKIKAVAEVESIKAIDEKDGIETRLVAFKLEKRVSDSPVPEEFVGSCQTIVKGKPKIGEALYFSPRKGGRFFVTVAEKDNEITSMTPMTPRLMNALAKTPDKVKFNIGQAYVDDGADEHLEKGEDSLKKRELRQAIVEANKAIQICNTYEMAFLLRGRIFIETEKYDSAEDDFNRAIELNPLLLDAYYQRGICKNAQRRFQAAIEDFSKVVEHDPSDMPALYCRAKAYKNNGQDDKALADYKKIEEADKDNHIVTREIAFIDYETGDLQGAKKQFARTLEIRPADMYAAIFLHIVDSKLKTPSSIVKFADSIKGSDEWPAPAVKMFAGQLTAEKCIDLSSSGKPADQWKLSGAYYYAGEKALIEGNDGLAASFFKKCVELKDTMGLEYAYAKRELEALRKKAEAPAAQ